MMTHITARIQCGIAALIVSGSGLLFGNGFTLERILGSPFPSQLTASPSGSKVAWVFNAQGKRNIWIAEAPDFRGRPLTRYDQDDGQEITGLSFSPDGGSIAYVRGGTKNSAGEVPNPTSNPAGARQEVWVVGRAGSPVRIAEGSNPAFFPAGDRVIFSREGDLWWAPARGGSEKKLFEIRGEVDSASWSPDGTLLLFANSRGDHSYIGIYEPRTSSLRFVQPTIDRDIAPRWSPDGKRIAFIRLANMVNTPSPDSERVVPWSILVVDAKTLQGREIWTSGKTERDSFSSVFAEDVLQWGPGNRLIFGSEKDGWAHLYAVSSEGGETVVLTPGDYEVEAVGLAPDRSFAAIATNAGDIDRRHLWKLDLASGSLESITKGEGIEVHPVLLSGGKQAAFLGSTATDPLMPYISSLNGSGARPLAPQALPADFPAKALVHPEQVTFQAADGVTIHAQLFLPRDRSAKMPAVLFMHGGPQRQMLLGWHYRGYYHRAYAFNQYLAGRGYAVLSVNYRSGIGYGRSFREARRRGARGASEYQDIVAGAKYLHSRSDIDAKRIGLWGGSYGGYLTAMGLARNSDLFAAGVDVHGVHDWSARVGRTPWAGGSESLIRLGRDSSPITSVDKWRSPVLLIHGDDDRNVAFNQTVELVRRLRDKGVKFEQLIFPDEVHDFLIHQHWLQAFRAAADFFDRSLR